MLRHLAIALLVALVVACGDTRTERGLTGAGIGAAGGVLLGPPGLIAGAAAGATTGVLTERDDLYLGRPVWD